MLAAGLLGACSHQKQDNEVSLCDEAIVMAWSSRRLSHCDSRR